MLARFATTGQMLRSVALRYRQPIGRPRRTVAAAAGISRFFPTEEPEPQFYAGNGPAARSPEIARLEAALFLARQPEGSRRLAQLAGLADGTKARTLARALNRLYDAGGSAFRVEELAGGFQLMTRAKFAPWLRRPQQGRVEVRLSAPAMETLAVVAYRQPVLRAEIEAIRGVQCGEILRQLIERDLVRIAGRSEELGRPLLYGTTKTFLQVFGLRHLEELPRAEAFRAPQQTAEDAEGVAVDGDRADTQIASQTNNLCHDAEEETDVKTLITTKDVRDELADDGVAEAVQTEMNQQPDDDLPIGEQFDEDDEEYEEDDYEYDDDDDDEEEEEEEEVEGEEDEAYEDEPWEEVEDDEEYEDDDWEEDDDWDDDDWEEEEEEQ